MLLKMKLTHTLIIDRFTKRKATFDFCACKIN